MYQSQATVNPKGRVRHGIPLREYRRRTNAVRSLGSRSFYKKVAPLYARPSWTSDMYRKKRFSKMAPTITNLDAKIDERINAERERVDMSDNGALWVEMVTNPFGSDTNLPVIVRFPDGEQDPTVLCKATCIYNRACGANESGAIQIHGWSWNGQEIGQIFWGADPFDPNVNMVNSDYIVARETASIAQVIPQNTEYRIVSAAIRVSPNSLETADGWFRAGHTNMSGEVAPGGVYPLNAMLNVKWDNHPYTIRDGITVRRLVNQPVYGTFNIPNANYWSGNQMSHGDMPYVAYSGTSATTVLHIEIVVYYEVRVQLISCLATHSIPREIELDHMITLVNSYKYHAAGASFSSFLKTMWNKVGDAAKWVWKQDPKAIVRGAQSLRDKAKSWLDAGKEVGKIATGIVS